MPDATPTTTLPTPALACPTTRLVIVDDHPQFRAATATALHANPNLTVLADGNSATQSLHLPGGGLNAARTIRNTLPGIKVITLTFSSDDEDVRAARHAGVHGDLLKSLGGTTLRRAVRALASGTDDYAPEVQAALTPGP